MLGVDVHTLGAVDVLNLINQQALSLRSPTQTQNFLRVQTTNRELLTGGDVVTVLDQQLRTTRHLNGDVFLVIVTLDDDDAVVRVVLVDFDGAIGLGHARHTLRRACLKQLLNTR